MEPAQKFFRKALAAHFLSLQTLAGAATTTYGISGCVITGFMLHCITKLIVLMLKLYFKYMGVGAARMYL